MLPQVEVASQKKDLIFEMLRTKKGAYSKLRTEKAKVWKMPKRGPQKDIKI